MMDESVAPGEVLEETLGEQGFVENAAEKVEKTVKIDG